MPGYLPKQRYTAFCQIPDGHCVDRHACLLPRDFQKRIGTRIIGFAVSLAPL